MGPASSAYGHATVYFADEDLAGALPAMAQAGSCALVMEGGALEYREIGAVAIDGFGSTNHLMGSFDALVYFDYTTPSVLLGSN